MSAHANRMKTIKGQLKKALARDDQQVLRAVALSQKARDILNLNPLDYKWTCAAWALQLIKEGLDDDAIVDGVVYHYRRRELTGLVD